ncbi:MAG: winged helix-turn-helix domain-containing protein [Candidatus Promineifilaceae bacterium]
MIPDNPFFHRGAIRRKEDFYGRAAETEQILGLFRNGQSVSVVGPRRIGKSSLLLHLCRETVRAQYGLQTPRSVFGLLDCQELAGSPPEEVYEALLRTIRAGAQVNGQQAKPGDEPGTYRALDQAIAALSRAGSAVILLLDEFELLAANERLTPYFFARLRGLTTKYGLAYLTASQRPLFSITADEQILSSPFFNIFVTLTLGLFRPEEARGLLSHRLNGTGMAIKPETAAHLIELMGPHPFFLHIAGYHAYRLLREGRTLDGRAGRSALHQAVAAEADAHLSYLWQNLTVEEQYCLAVADGPVDVMRWLEQQSLVVPSDSGYAYTSQLLADYVRRQPVPGLVQAGPFVIDDQRHKVFANGRPIDLTASQYELLMRLGRSHGQVVTAEELALAVWGDNLADDPDRLKTLIKRLRRAVDPFNNWIISERGVGYVLRAPEG